MIGMISTMIGTMIGIMIGIMIEKDMIDMVINIMTSMV
jgi:hypothetical protein